MQQQQCHRPPCPSTYGSLHTPHAAIGSPPTLSPYLWHHALPPTQQHVHPLPCPPTYGFLHHAPQRSSKVAPCPAILPMAPCNPSQHSTMSPPAMPSYLWLPPKRSSRVTPAMPSYLWLHEPPPNTTARSPRPCPPTYGSLHPPNASAGPCPPPMAPCTPPMLHHARPLPCPPIYGTMHSPQRNNMVAPCPIPLPMAPCTPPHAATSLPPALSTDLWLPTSPPHTATWLPPAMPSYLWLPAPPTHTEQQLRSLPALPSYLWLPAHTHMQSKDNEWPAGLHGLLAPSWSTS